MDVQAGREVIGAIAARRLARASIAVWSFAIASACCKVPLQQRVNVADAKNRQLKFQVDATDKANQALRDYAAELNGAAPARPSFSMLYRPYDLTTMATHTVPYRIDAREFNNQLSGTIVVESVTGFVFHPGNHVTCNMRLHGENVEYHGNVPSMYQNMVTEFQQGVAAGVMTDLDVVVSHQGNQVLAQVQVTAAHMLKNSSDLFESNLRDQMNQNAFRDPVGFDVRIEGRSATVQRVLVTGGHLVIGYVAQ